MRPAPPYGASKLGARGGIAPALLLDVQTPSGAVYYWSDRKLTGVQCAIGAAGLPGNPELVNYTPWIVGVGSFKSNRSLITDTGSITLQNVSGDVLTRDFERIVRRGTLEGSLFVFRYYDVGLQYAIREHHGTLSCGDQGTTVTVTLSQLLAGQDDTPQQQVSENCQLNWAAGRCPADPAGVECLYTYATCQVPDRFVGIQTAFEVNNPATVAQLPTTTINRARAV